MRDNAPREITTLAADEALAYVREVEHLDAALAGYFRGDGMPSGLTVQAANARLGVVLKLAAVHAQLATAEQLAGLRADMREAASEANDDLMALAEAVAGGPPPDTDEVPTIGSYL